MKVENRKSFKINIIHMGGTFGMAKQSDCFKVQPNFLWTQLKEENRINHSEDPMTEYYESNGVKIFLSFYEDEIKDSSNLEIKDCVNLTNIIERMYDEYDGFIIINGTDTMSYSASALSFLIENISKPIIFTGAMIPIKEPESDAIDNLEGALKCFCQQLEANIYLYFNGKLMQGNRTTKFSSTGLDAFACNGNCQISSKGPVRFYHKMSEEVAVIKIYPGMDIDKLKVIFKMFKGIVIESFGSGNVPNKLIKAIEDSSKDMCFLNITQCVHGSATNIYENGKILIDRGIVFCGHDMTTESGFAKLSFLIGNYEISEVKNLLSENLRGEFTK